MLSVSFESYIYAIVVVGIILEIFKILALDVLSLICKILNQSLSRWPWEKRNYDLYARHGAISSSVRNEVFKPPGALDELSL